MSPYTTSKSNLTAQELDYETLAALKLHPPEKKLQALLGILEKQEEDMDPTQQRTGSFTAATHIRPGELEPEIRLQALFYQMGTHLQKAMDDGRIYTVEVQITTYVTVDPIQAKIGEYVHRDYFKSNPIPPDQEGNQALEIRSSSCTQVRTFQPTRLGYQRIE